MTEEEYFRKTYPDSCYGDKPLSPYWDFFQDGVEFGERQSEKKIEELEHKLEQTEKDLADYQFNYPTIKDLEKENALLKGRNEGFEQQIIGLLIKYEEVYKRFPDLKSAMDKAQTILKENAELKKELKVWNDTKDARLTIYFQQKHKIADLEKENAELKKENEELPTIVFQQGAEWYKKKADIKLTKAKEIIYRLMDIINHDLKCFDTMAGLDVKQKAEQFLKEIEKCNM